MAYLLQHTKITNGESSRYLITYFSWTMDSKYNLYGLDPEHGSLVEYSWCSILPIDRDNQFAIPNILTAGVDIDWKTTFGSL